MKDTLYKADEMIYFGSSPHDIVHYGCPHCYSGKMFYTREKYRGHFCLSLCLECNESGRVIDFWGVIKGLVRICFLE